MKIHYKIAGLLALGLGILGAFLPLLPTTVFILLAAWCFAKSSPKWHQRLLNNTLFGPMIEQWESGQCIPNKAKVIAISSMLIFGTLSFLVMENMWLRIALVALICSGIYSLHYFNQRQRKRLQLKNCPIKTANPKASH